MAIVKLENRAWREPFADLAAAKAFDYTLVNDGVEFKILTLGLYYYDSTSAEVADDLNVITPTGGGTGRLLLQVMNGFKVTAGGKIDRSILPYGGPFDFKGEIAVAADFPTLADVKDGWTYKTIGDPDVTDNDPTKTNTGQTFKNGSIIAFSFGSPNKWVDLTGLEVWIDDGTKVDPINARDVNIATGQTYKINNVDINVAGTLSNVAYLDQENTFSQPQIINGGLKDTNVTTAVALGSATDTSLNTTKKDLLGGINELEQIRDLTLEPTGFAEPADVIETYDDSARTITLTGTVNGYYRGEKVAALVSSWVSDPHPVTTSKQYFLVYNGSTFEWLELGVDPFVFSDLLIGFVEYGISNKFAIRECHGFQPWQSHEEDHDNFGTYKQSGGTLADYVLSSTTAADRRPSISPALIKDEDLPTTNPVLAAGGNYTNFSLSGAGGSTVFDKAAVEIVPVSGTQPYYNQFTGGSWQQTLMSNNNYMAIWVMAIPVTADAGSQSYRYLFVQGQQQSLVLNTINSLTTGDVNLGELTGFVPELIFTSKIIIKYQGGDWFWISEEPLTGSRYSQVSSPGGLYLSSVTADSTLTGLGTPASPLGIDLTNANTWTGIQDFNSGFDVASSGTTITSISTGAADNDKMVTKGYVDDADATFLKKDGSTPLTNNWDAGSYKITAETLESDIATGTAPLVVASTTVVSNLNADTVDGKNETDFALLAGRAGGQVLYGGNAASENLTLGSTAHGTKGNIFLQDKVSIGTTTTTVDISGVSVTANILDQTNNLATVVNHIGIRNSDSAVCGARSLYLRSRGTSGAETIVVNGDSLGCLDFGGWDGVDYVLAAQIDCEVDGVPGANDMPGRIIIAVTPDGAFSPVEAVRISQDKSVLLAGDLSVPKLDVDNVRIDGNQISATTGNLLITGTGLTNVIISGVANQITGTLALASGTSVNEFSIDGTLIGNSDNAIPTEQAVKTYVDSKSHVWNRVTGPPNYVIPSTAADDIGATGARITKGWFTDLEITNMPTVSGTSINNNGVLSLASGEVTQLANIGAATVSSGQWVYLGAMDQGVAQADSVVHAGISAGKDTDTACYLGRGYFGFLTGGASDSMYIGHVDFETSNDFALAFTPSVKRTYLNAPATGSLNFRINNVSTMVMDATELNFGALNLKDTYVTGLPLGQSGQTALVGFTATSIMGALNELKTQIGGKDEFSELNDVSGFYGSSAANSIVRVNAANNGIEPSAATLTAAGTLSVLTSTTTSAASPTHYTLSRMGSSADVGIKCINDDNEIHFGMNSSEEFAVALTSNLGSSPLLRVTRDGDVIAGRYFKANEATKYMYGASVADDDTVTIETSKHGRIWVMAGDNEEEMTVYFKDDGTVEFVSGTTNTAITDSDTDLCVFSDGGTITVKNRLGSAKDILFEVLYM